MCMYAYFSSVLQPWEIESGHKWQKHIHVGNLRHPKLMTRENCTAVAVWTDHQLITRRAAEVSYTGYSLYCFTASSVLLFLGQGVN